MSAEDAAAATPATSVAEYHAVANQPTAGTLRRDSASAPNGENGKRRAPRDMDANPASRMHHARRFVFRPSSAKSDAAFADASASAHVARPVRGPRQGSNRPSSPTAARTDTTPPAGTAE